MSQETERLDAWEDPEKPERRRIPLMLLVVLFVICATVGVFAGFASGAFGGGPSTEEPPQTEEVVLMSTVTGGSATQPSPTDPPTDQVSTEEIITVTAATEEVVTPTEETITVTVPSGGVVSSCTATCGDGVCCIGRENSDLCAADCPCHDNGSCEAGEGASCRDCGSSAGTCGAPCTDSSQCGGGLSCAGGVCWNACTCGGGSGCVDSPPPPDNTGACAPCGPTYNTVQGACWPDTAICGSFCEYYYHYLDACGNVCKIEFAFCFG